MRGGLLEASVEIGAVEEVLTDNAPLALHGCLWELDQELATFAEHVVSGDKAEHAVVFGDEARPARAGHPSKRCFPQRCK